MAMDLVTYLANMTGYTFSREQLNVIITKYSLEDKKPEELTKRERNLCLADLLFVIFTSPSSGGSVTRQHGDYSVTIGATQITDKADIYKLMTALYENPDAEMSDVLASYQGGVSWVNEIF